VDEGRWPEAWALLSARWRARETPERLAGDLAASGPVGPSAVSRAKAALALADLRKDLGPTFREQPLCQADAGGFRLRFRPDGRRAAAADGSIATE